MAMARAKRKRSSRGGAEPGYEPSQRIKCCIIISNGRMHRVAGCLVGETLYPHVSCRGWVKGRGSFLQFKHGMGLTSTWPCSMFLFRSVMCSVLLCAGTVLMAGALTHNQAEVEGRTWRRLPLLWPTSGSPSACHAHTSSDGTTGAHHHHSYYDNDVGWSEEQQHQQQHQQKQNQPQQQHQDTEKKSL